MPAALPCLCLLNPPVLPGDLALPGHAQALEEMGPINVQNVEGNTCLQKDFKSARPAGAGVRSWLAASAAELLALGRRHHGHHGACAGGRGAA